MSPPRTPLLTVDAVITDPCRGVLLIQRGHPPFQGCWALPGGFVEPGERCEDACRREVREETGLDVTISSLLGVYSTPGRDPRGSTASVVYLCRAAVAPPVAGDDAASVRWWKDLAGADLAFDHAGILADAFFSVD